ncbi:hypothetical protein C8R45DRAFT_1115550 [Mycena sanguinolenta]|nr:hypothetical protein C8R45DRAFT_1115550 [Mycena sanguinolenta]
MNTRDEICCYYGPKFRPHKNTNLRHRVLLHKALELSTETEIEEHLGRFNQFSTVMGTVGNAHRLGTLQASREVNAKRRNREGPTPSRDVRRRLQAYLDAYDGCFKKQGSVFRIHDEPRIAVLQDAEQAWHDWIVGYLGRPRPQWALEPLPGFSRVRVAAPAPPRGGKRKRAHGAGPDVPSKKFKFLGTIDLTLD